MTLLRKLNRKKYREQEQLFIIEGSRAVEQLVDNGRIEVEWLCFDESQHYWESQPWDEYASSFEYVSVAQAEFAEASNTDNPQGVLAVCKIPEEAEINHLSNKKGIVVATDAIQDPGNLGTIIRTASWFGVSALLSGKGTVDLFNPKVVRSTAGATGVIPHINGDLFDDLSLLESEGWRVVLLDGSANSTDIKNIDFASKIVLVVGNEANGINSSLITDSRIKARISSPTQNEYVESLNAAVATSIALFSLAK